MTLLQRWLLAPRLRQNRIVAKICRTLRISKLLLKVHKRSFDTVLSGRYGKDIQIRKSGYISTQGTSFKFHDPSLGYLKLFAVGGEYEPAVTDHLRRLIADRKTCFMDVGSHFGFFTVFVAAINPETEIHSFEPSSRSYAVLSENVKVNHIKAQTYKLALSDAAGEVSLYGRSMKSTNGKPPETVTAVPFDTLNESIGIRPEIAKVDVHGSEGKVLFGMKKALRESIKHLYLELHPEEILVDYSIRDIIDLLLTSGFTLEEISRFRERNTASFSPISDVDYNKLIKPSCWTTQEINDRRMLYAHK